MSLSPYGDTWGANTTKAMARGLPFIATDFQAVPDMLKPHQNSVLREIENRATEQVAEDTGLALKDYYKATSIKEEHARNLILQKVVGS